MMSTRVTGARITQAGKARRNFYTSLTIFRARPHTHLTIRWFNSVERRCTMQVTKMDSRTAGRAAIAARPANNSATRGNTMKKILVGLACCALAGSAFAFPTWMGVYGSFVRHTDGTNPGTFTVLMNQDYFGLHAN